MLNETADFYRFFDATPQAEFLSKRAREGEFAAMTDAEAAAAEQAYADLFSETAEG